MIEFRVKCPVSISPVLGGMWKTLRNPAARDASKTPGQGVVTCIAQAKLPKLTLEIAQDPATAPAVEQQPPAALWASLPPSPVESWISASHATQWIQSASRTRKTRGAARLSVVSKLLQAAPAAIAPQQPSTASWASLPPAAVESWISTAQATEWIQSNAAGNVAQLAAHLSGPAPEFSAPTPVAVVQEPPIASSAPFPPAAVESWIAISDAAQWAEYAPAVQARFDSLIAPLAPEFAEPAASPAATEVASFVAPATALELEHKAVASTPRFEIAALSDASTAQAEEPVEVVAACEQWMPTPAADPVASWITPADSCRMLAAISLRAPQLAGFTVGQTYIPTSVKLARPQKPEPVVMFVRPTNAASNIPPLPALLRGTDPILDLTLEIAPYVDGPQAMPVESMPAEQVVLPAAAASIAPITTLGQNRLPQPACITGHKPASHAPVPVEDFVFPTYRATMMATLEVALPVFPLTASLDGISALPSSGADAATMPAPQSLIFESTRPTIEPIRTLALVPPHPETERPAAVAVPQHGFVPVEFFCQRPGGSVSRCLDWQVRPLELAPPPFALRPVADKHEEESAPQKKVAKKPAMAEIFKLPEAKRKASSPAVHHAIKAIAACVVMGGVLWFGLGAFRIGSHTPAVNRDVSMILSATESTSDSPVTTTTASNGSLSAAKPGAPAAEQHGAMARFRQAVSNRAAATVTDSFRNGMEAWGTKPKAWAAGWSRHPEGYVQPGQLAIFGPTVNYKDYHLEFFGQIDNKSMGWTVRSKDTKNYYAMKFSVVDPGLRPIIAMIHYPVVAGRKGKPVSTPLNVMVHNNKPFQVAVDVKGNRMVTSIDGQEVDTWIDDSIPQGGVGFFADAGEKSRLYWMKVSKNEDFLGRVCAYLSSKLGDGSNTGAELWAPEVPGSLPHPGSRIPAHSDEAALSAAVLGIGGTRRRRAGLASCQAISFRRSDRWNS